ncbi:MAG: tRNA dimethylallyltransferase, partial [candidate division Zixibacteria bacterium]|nr:tRNA dimethylallyltransferase [candidate division Zixibacteria bacterium]
RALEIFSVTGKTKSELVTTGVYRKSSRRFTYYGFLPPRQTLYADINNRVDEMMACGLLGELQRLVDLGRGEDIRLARVIGYSELLEFLEEKISLDEAVNLMKQNTRRYAKRQYTWFTRQTACRVFTDRNGLLKALDTDLKLWQ